MARTRTSPRNSSRRKPRRLLPKRVRVAGEWVQIRVSRGPIDDEGTYAQYEDDCRTIRICPTVARGDKKVLWTTLQHELMEAVLYITGVGWSEKYNQEAVVRACEVHLFPLQDRLRPRFR